MSVDDAVAIALDAQKNGEVVSLVGPTASGKTAAAIAICEAIGGEIVSVDSVQIYRSFDIGSGKPTDDERARVPHHLIDSLDPLESIDAMQFAVKARDVITQIRARGRIPVACGGTFLWQKSLFFGLAEAPAANFQLREKHRALAESEGRVALHQQLSMIDPESAARLHPNDLVRVSRALEVYELTGETQSARHAQHAFSRVVLAPRFIAVDVDAGALTKRIAARVASFLARGLVEETRALVARGYGSARAMGAVGYKEVAAHLRGELAATDLETAIIRATRVYARRQRTWLNHVAVTRVQIDG